MLLEIKKYRSWDEVPQNSKEYWQRKSIDERLNSVEVIIEQILFIRPDLKENARPFPKIYPIIKQRGS